MGSFNLSCAISGLTIGYEDESYFIFLLPKKCSQRERQTTGSNQLLPLVNGQSCYFIHNDDLYIPILLPILGEYSTYGYLEKITEDENTQLLEEMFGIRAEDVIKILRNNTFYGEERRKKALEEAKALAGKDKKNLGLLCQLSGMFIHKDIYEHLANYYEPAPIWHPGFNLDLEDAYDCLQQALIDFDQEDPNETVEAHRERQLLSFFKDPMRGEYPDDGKYHLGHFINHKWFSLKDTYRPLIKAGKLKKALCDFLRFDYNMQLCNKLYFPSNSGGQEGSMQEANMALYKAALGVIGRKVAKNAEENIVDTARCKFCNKLKEQYLEHSCKECHLMYCGW